jgi:hypothetical protein
VDLGQLTLTPKPLFNSISGRLVDALSGNPLTPDFYPAVELWRCENGYCGAHIGSAYPDQEGVFRIDASTVYGLLTVGDYIINFNAAQYQFGSFGPFAVGPNEDYNLGDVAVQPNAVQFFDPQGCPEIPARGGDCTYSIRINNGRSQTVNLQVWNQITTYGPISASFQPQSARSVRLRSGASRVVSFHMSVPRSVPPYTSFCATLYVADEGRGFYFQPIGSASIFCGYKAENGVIRQIPAEEARTLLQRMQNVPAAQKSRK